MNTKKDFIACAAIIRASVQASARALSEGGDVPTCNAWRASAQEFARAFANHYASENPRFDRVRFFEACGLNENGEGV